MWLLASGCTYEHATHWLCRLVKEVVGCSGLWQEIARLMMEQEKKEYKKLREREKERERERAAMEKMAMEKRRHEGDYRVIFQKQRDFMCTLE